MSIKELIEELRKHEGNLPVVLCNNKLYDEDIKVKFESDIGVTVYSVAINSAIDELIEAAVGLLNIEIAEKEIIPYDYWTAADKLEDTLLSFGVEVA